MESIIYTITNIINNKIYVGQSKNIKNRWASHKSLLIDNKHHNKHLQKAVNKYGFENFKFDIVEYCNENVINEREMYWINTLKTFNSDYGYNKTLGGDGNKGGVYSKEAREKISKAHKGRKHTDKTRKRMSEANKGKKLSDVTRQKMSSYRKDNLNAKKVICIEDNLVFVSVIRAAEYYKVSYGAISGFLNGTIKKSKLNKTFKFYEQT